MAAVTDHGPEPEPEPEPEPKSEHGHQDSSSAVEMGIVSHPSSVNPSSSSSSSKFSKSFLLDPVSLEWSDLILLTHSLTTGMVDAAVFYNWGVFVGMQTGNTVILGLSTTTLANNPHAWLTTLVSISSFLLGAFSTFRLTAFMVPVLSRSDKPCPSAQPVISRSRLWLFAILLIQALLILLAAALTTPEDVIPQNPPLRYLNPEIAEQTLQNIRIVSLLPPLAFQSGMQIATSRLLGYNELPVNVLTSTYCDLMGDPKLFLGLRANAKRNRRVASVVLLLAGSIVSGWLMKSPASLRAVFWIAGGSKLFAALAALFLLKRAASVSL